MPDVQQQRTKDVLKSKIDALPPALLGEVEDFVDFVVTKHTGSSEDPDAEKERVLRQDWAGGLRHLKEEYTSAELKDKALEWWAEAVQD